MYSDPGLWPGTRKQSFCAQVMMFLHFRETRFEETNFVEKHARRLFKLVYFLAGYMLPKRPSPNFLPLCDKMLREKNEIVPKFQTESSHSLRNEASASWKFWKFSQRHRLPQNYIKY